MNNFSEIMQSHVSLPQIQNLTQEPVLLVPHLFSNTAKDTNQK